jgi:transcriptional regulator with GAF, ATPase, and Fis domain
MVSGIDPGVAARSVQELRQTDLATGELQASLRAVADATATIFEADGGGIMLLDDQQVLHYVGATSGRSAALEAAQEETGEGPCVDSLMNDVLVQTVDLTADERWPELRRQVADLGVRAVLGVPLHLGLSAVGSLNIYRCEPCEWTGSDVEAIRAHGQIIEELLATAMFGHRQHTIVEQLTQALTNRVVIERAIGVIVASHDLDPVPAFNALRRFARDRRVRVAEAAERVVRTRSFPPTDEPNEVRP